MKCDDFPPLQRSAAPVAPALMILLAPMEGLLDFVLRDILTRVGGIDRCVSEFIFEITFLRLHILCTLSTSTAKQMPPPR